MTGPITLSTTPSLILFKQINDHFRHVKGDEVLIRVSSILSAAIGDCGFIGRWGGEEFLIVLESERFGTILEKANEIRKAVSEYRHEDIGKNITSTMGFSQYRENIPLDLIIANADKALYQGKSAARNQCVISA